MIRLGFLGLLGLGLSVLAATPAWSQPIEPRFLLELEGGAVWQSRNDVQVPNDETGTRFSVVDLIGSGPSPAGRLSLVWNLREKQSLKLVLAPLEIDGTGVSTESIDFNGESFEAGFPIDASYQFNSWRLGYRFRFYHRERWTLRAGFTAKVRDAEIRLEQAGAQSSKTSVGFVPLAHSAASIASPSAGASVSSSTLWPVDLAAPRVWRSSSATRFRIGG